MAARVRGWTMAVRSMRTFQPTHALLFPRVHHGPRVRHDSNAIMLPGNLTHQVVVTAPSSPHSNSAQLRVPVDVQTAPAAYRRPLCRHPVRPAAPAPAGPAERGTRQEADTPVTHLQRSPLRRGGEAFGGLLARRAQSAQQSSQGPRVLRTTHRARSAHTGVLKVALGAWSRPPTAPASPYRAHHHFPASEPRANKDSENDENRASRTAERKKKSRQILVECRLVFPKSRSAAGALLQALRRNQVQGL